MYDTDTWIWIPHSMYPGHQTTVYSALADQSCGHYTVAEFMRTYHLEQAPAGIRLRVSGDTVFQLFLNGQAVNIAAQAQKQVVDNIRSRGSRPAENGTVSRSGFTYKSDVSKLSKEDRAEIARRAARGETITFR